MESQVYLQLQSLINEYQTSGYSEAWMQKSHIVLGSLFKNHSDEQRNFLRANQEHKVSVLQALAAKELDLEALRQAPKNSGIHISLTNTQNQSSAISVHNEISLNILLQIEQSDELSTEEKEEAKQLYEEVEEEVKKPEPNWKKVTNLLKRSFDYGLKIAPDIVKLADAYYRSKFIK